MQQLSYCKVISTAVVPDDQGKGTLEVIQPG